MCTSVAGQYTTDQLPLGHSPPTPLCACPRRRVVSLNRTWDDTLSLARYHPYPIFFLEMF